MGRLGTLIGAPVCQPQLVRIPSDLVGWEFRPGHTLVEGWAHGSLAVDRVVETHSLTHRAMDDNARRHAGIYALCDWAGGADYQWLLRGTDNEYFSHDHGWYLPPAGASWSVQTLQAATGTAFELPDSPVGLDVAELNRIASTLQKLRLKEVEYAVANIPADWPVTDAELDAVVDFAYARRDAVADRLLQLANAAV